MRIILLLVSAVFFCFSSLAGNMSSSEPIRKSVSIQKTSFSPDIDGLADDSTWQNILPLTDFRQYQPVYEASTSFRTEVKITYDDYAIYVFAHLSDPSPDSILRQLGVRDEEYLNADMFSIGFDTYNNQLDAYYFTVTASGVQLDSRESDETYDAVWDSEVKITNDGWVAEIKIPYSALRFARKPSQTWGMQITRTIRRFRETDQWSLEVLDADNDLPYWGTLEGLKNLEPPVRLSATPYLLLQAEHYPVETSGNDISTAVGGGMDLKYGLSESYTVDMSLLPDFSQVQSDNKIKNLTAFETVYDEQRPFFKEAVDLFMKGDIFYSRRIGKTPALFYEAEESLAENEHLVKNPVQQKLLNATKISGRNRKGFAVGLLNAVTANTYAVAQDNEGNKRQILTDPLTNYNLLVFDQALKNNSDVYISNTNVIRDNYFRDANVTAAGLTLNNKSNTYQIHASGGMSQVYNGESSTGSQVTNTKGYKYTLGIEKTKGNFQWSVYRSGMDDKFDANDMGLTIFNNYNSNVASISYNFYKPFWKLREMMNTLSLSNQNNFTTHKVEKARLQYNSFLTTLNYLFIWFNAGHLLTETYDYYEPRTAGMYYLQSKSTWSNIGFSSDYRKPVAIDGSISGYYSSRDESKGFSTEISPILRLNNHFTFKCSSYFERNINDFGFAAKTGDLVIFGSREIKTVINSLNSKYLFKNNVSLSLIARHYYSRGAYNGYFELLNNGRLNPLPGYEGNHNFNFNAFTVDMVFSWIFSPGSSFNLVWKNEITSETDVVSGGYLTNLNDNFNEPQLNNISLKVLYYIDYQRLKRK